MADTTLDRESTPAGAENDMEYVSELEDDFSDHDDRVPLYTEDANKFSTPWQIMYPVKEKRKWRLKHEILQAKQRAQRNADRESDDGESNAEKDGIGGGPDEGAASDGSEEMISHCGRQIEDHETDEDAESEDDSDFAFLDIPTTPINRDHENDEAITIGDSDEYNSDTAANILIDSDDDDDSVPGVNLDEEVDARYAAIEQLTTPRGMAEKRESLQREHDELPAGCINECLHWSPYVELLTRKTDPSQDDPAAPIILYPISRSPKHPCFSWQGTKWKSATPGMNMSLKMSANTMKGVRRLVGTLRVPKIAPVASTICYRAIHSGYPGAGLLARSMQPAAGEDGQLVDTAHLTFENEQLYIERHLRWQRRHPSPYLSVTKSLAKLRRVIEVFETSKKHLAVSRIQVIAFEARGLEFARPRAVFAKLNPTGLYEHWTENEWLRAFEIPADRVLKRVDIRDTPEHMFEAWKVAHPGVEVSRLAIRREHIEEQLRAIQVSGEYLNPPGIELSGFKQTVP